MATISIAKITNTSELETATPEEVAAVYEYNNNTNKFTNDEKTKLAGCKPVPFITQAEYDAIAVKDENTLYAILPEV